MIFASEEKIRHPWRLACIIFAILGILIFVAGFVLVRLWQGGAVHVPTSVVDRTAQVVIDRFAGSTIPKEKRDLLASRVSGMLGFDTPRTYLLLLQNNTELRPGGGFIGSYAVVTLDRGQVNVRVLEGSEAVDKATPSGLMVPPTPLVTYLGVPTWYFRDANWSPDFPTSANEVLKAYRRAHGAYADDIDVVAAVTPTVLEGLLRKIGPVTVQGKTFTAENVTEKLQYEVEYAYVDQGLKEEDRKSILSPFFETLLAAAARDFFRAPEVYQSLGEEMIRQKQLVAYSADSFFGDLIAAYGAGGEVVTSTPNDYILWVDANLGALKTDHAMRRRLSYELRPDGKGGYIATVAMAYRHVGTFDWRTTRYQTYARVYVPPNATFLSVEGMHKNGKPITRNDVATGQELGKEWYGVFFSVEPGETKELVFEYAVPTSVVEQIKQGAYALLVQKQLGVVPYGLTLSLNFGTSIVDAQPPEAREKWGDSLYSFETTLQEDLPFRVDVQKP
jgi:hypothetical protein